MNKASFTLPLSNILIFNYEYMPFDKSGIFSV